MKKTPWFSGYTVPARRGFYERDHRQVAYLSAKDRRITLDLWEPVPQRGHILHPGVWYIVDEHGTNDAVFQNLPWRGLMKESA